MSAEQLMDKMRVGNPTIKVRTNDKGTRVEVFYDGEWKVYAMLGIDGKWYHA